MCLFIHNVKKVIYDENDFVFLKIWSRNLHEVVHYTSIYDYTFSICLFSAPYEKKLIHDAVKEIEENTRIDGENCITFVNKTTETTYLFYSTGRG